MSARTPATPQEWEQYFDLHFRVLRQPLGMPRVDEDILKDDAFSHAAAFKDGKVVSIARAKVSLDEGQATGQVRGVATDPDYLMQGYGKAVMQFVEEEAWRLGLEYLWLNARIGAVDFYKSLGYAVEKDIGEYLPGVPHFRMGKKL